MSMKYWLKRMMIVCISLLCIPAFNLAASANSGSVDILIKEISAEDLLKKQATSHDFILLDVRTAEEYFDGHIQGAVNIGLSDISSKAAQLSVYKNTEIVVYCRSGRRAGIAANELRALGFQKLSHLSGDLLYWNEKKLPLVK